MTIWIAPSLALAVTLSPPHWPAQIVVPDPDQPPPFVVQEPQVEPREEDNDGEDPIIPAPPLTEDPLVIVPKATPAATRLILKQIQEDAGVCDEVPGPYVIDCLAKRFERTARRMPQTGDYAVARDALETAAAELSQIVGQSRALTLDRESIVVTTRNSNGTAERTRLRKVPDRTAEAARARAVEVLEEQATILLRSAAENPGEAVHYTRIAQAVESTKVLLRS